jgi:2-polyprenyl-3-methyl-5-hydroxy-6-metoxy-1,4-benzoquinol methylase
MENWPAIAIALSGVAPLHTRGNLRVRVAVREDANVSVSSKYATGRGPGHITPDGCPVDLYSLLPPGEAEAELVASVAPARGTVLELGAGAGRVTHRLIERGFTVVAVDESAQMLDRIDGAETVVSTIEDLQLRRRFDVVVLGSHLINLPGDDAVAALLDACARHVAPGGHVLIERRDPRWFDTATEGEVACDGIVYAVAGISRSGDRITATFTYTVEDRSWSQTFTTRRVDDDRLEHMLAEADLALAGYMDEARTWAAAQALTASRP